MTALDDLLETPEPIETPDQPSALIPMVRGCHGFIALLSWTDGEPCAEAAADVPRFDDDGQPTGDLFVRKGDLIILTADESREAAKALLYVAWQNRGGK